MMPAVRNYLAFDLGAESGRAMFATLSLGRLEIRELSRFPNTPLHLGPSLRWDMDAMDRGVDAGLAAAAGTRLDGVGVDTWGCDYGLIDERGSLIEPPYHYRDHRTDGVMARVLERIGRARIYETTGVQCLPFNTLYQLVAAHESPTGALARAHRLLTIADLVNHRLTGRSACEYTNATTTQCIDARTGTWAVDLLSALDLPARIFGEIVAPGTRLGPLVRQIAPSLNGTSVIAPACHDTGSAFASVEAANGTALLSCGTWSLLGAEVRTPVITSRSLELNFTNEGGADGTFRLLKNIGGLWLLQSCRKTWEGHGEAWTYEELARRATDDRHAFRAVLDPDDPAFLNPHDMVAAIADYCVRTGQPIPDGPGGYTRTILESLALKYRMVLDWLEELIGASFTTIRVVGGGSRNTLLSQLTADATGRTVLAGPVEATTLGNVAVQMVATGAVASLAEGRAIVNESFPPMAFGPKPARAWDDALSRLRDLSAESSARQNPKM
jgi:rhamnulokinase